MNNTFLTTELYKIGAIQFGEFTLKSGQISPIYLNLRKIISYPALLRAIATAMWDASKQCDFHLICGVPYTALPIASCISLDHNLPMIMRRKEKKDYGTKQLIEGEFKPGERVLIIEDVITTGSSIMETANDLIQAGLVIQDVVVLVDREQGGKKNLEMKYNVHTILTLTTILTTLLATNITTPAERQIIEKLLIERST